MRKVDVASGVQGAELPRRLDNVVDPTRPQGLELDVCLSCACIWFDRGEYDEVPRGGAAGLVSRFAADVDPRRAPAREPRPLKMKGLGEGTVGPAATVRREPPRVRPPAPRRADAKEERTAGTKRMLDALRTAPSAPRDGPDLRAAPSAPRDGPDLRADEEKQKRHDDATRKGPDARWKYLPAILFYPVECGMEAPSRKPWVTWGATALMVIVFAFSVAMGPAFFNRMGEAWGFVPSAWLRLGGLTLLTGFFIHAGLWHLLGNSYFLMVFGDNVEDNIGRGRYVWLILAAHLAGYAAHGLFDSDPSRFLVGASAGISGVIAYYAIAFPRAKLGFLFIVKWFRLPAWGAFILWVLLQVITAKLQTEGKTDVSGLAHLGGAGVGVVAALTLRKRRRVRGATGEQSRADFKRPDLVRHVARSAGTGLREATPEPSRREDPQTEVRRPRQGAGVSSTARSRREYHGHAYARSPGAARTK